MAVTVEGERTAGESAAASYDEAERYSNLLKYFFLLKNGIDSNASANGERFNVFSILGRERDEVQTHSPMIAELLNPNGLHGQGEVFARLFCDEIELEIDSELCNAKVDTEVHAQDLGTIDILFRTLNRCIVIENKIDAKDRWRQLERYHQYARRLNATGDTAILYLTLDGSEPSKDSLGSLKLDDVRCISYESHIIDWLAKCINEAARIPQVRELLFQYQSLLRKLTGKHEGVLNMELGNLLKEKQGDRYNFELVQHLADALEELRIDLVWRFWKRIRDRMEDSGESGQWHLELCQVVDCLEVERQVVENAYTKKRYAPKDYGWTFRVCPARRLFVEPPFEIVLRVEVEVGRPTWSKVFFGFLLVKQSGEDLKRVTGSDLNERSHVKAFRAHAAAIGLKLSDGEKWVSWRYSKRDLTFASESSPNERLQRRLIEDPQAVTDELAAEIDETISMLIGRSSTGESVLEGSVPQHAD